MSINLSVVCVVSYRPVSFSFVPASYRGRCLENPACEILALPSSEDVDYISVNGSLVNPLYLVVEFVRFLGENGVLCTR